MLPLAGRALDPEHWLLGSLCLLTQDGLGLTSEALLLAVVSPPALSLLRFCRLLILGHLEFLVLVAFCTEGVPGLWDINHLREVSTISLVEVNQAIIAWWCLLHFAQKVF